MTAAWPRPRPCRRCTNGQTVANSASKKGIRLAEKAESGLFFYPHAPVRLLCGGPAATHNHIESQQGCNMKKSTTKKPAPKAKDLKPTKNAKGGAIRKNK
jgi:hypothetical protein